MPYANFGQPALPILHTTPLHVENSFIPVGVSQTGVGNARARVQEYETPLFPDGVVLPPDVCALLRFPYGTVSRGLNLTLSMLEEIKMQQMRLEPKASYTVLQYAKTLSPVTSPSLASQSTTPEASSPIMEATQLVNNMSSFDSASTVPAEGLFSDSIQEFDAETDFANESRVQSILPKAGFPHQEVELDLYESNETVMLPCCRSYVPRSKAEAALKHSASCPCCQSQGVDASMLIAIDKQEHEALKSVVLLPCCRSRVPRDKISKKLLHSDRCPCCKTEGIAFPLLRPLLSDAAQELPDLQASADSWTDKVVMPCCQSHVCRAQAEQQVKDSSECLICNHAGLTVAQLLPVEISSAVCEAAWAQERRRRSTLVVRFMPPTVSFAVDCERSDTRDVQPPSSSETATKRPEEKAWLSATDVVAAQMQEDAHGTGPASAPANSAASTGGEAASGSDFGRAYSANVYFGGGVDDSPARGVKFFTTQFSQSANALLGGLGPCSVKAAATRNPTPQGFIRNTTMFSDAPKLFSDAPKLINHLHAAGASPRSSPLAPPSTPQCQLRAVLMQEEMDAEEVKVATAVCEDEEGWEDMSLSFVSQLLHEEAAKKLEGAHWQEVEGEAEHHHVVVPSRAK